MAVSVVILLNDFVKFYSQIFFSSFFSPLSQFLFFLQLSLLLHSFSQVLWYRWYIQLWVPAGAFGTNCLTVSYQRYSQCEKFIRVNRCDELIGPGRESPGGRQRRGGWSPLPVLLPLEQILWTYMLLFACFCSNISSSSDSSFFCNQFCFFFLAQV